MELSEDVLSELKAESSELVEKFARTWMVMNSRLDSCEPIERGDVDELFRILHTLKGLSEIIGLSRVVSALHLMEDRLSEVRAESSYLNRYDLENLAECQLLLEKIFILSNQQEDLDLTLSLERCAHLFCQNGDNNSSAKTGETGFEKQEPLTENELNLWRKYEMQTGFVYAHICELIALERRDQILSIGEILVERSVSQKMLLVFASELDKALVDQIFEKDIFQLTKDLSELLSPNQPWSDFLVLSEITSKGIQVEAESKTDNVKVLDPEPQMGAQIEQKIEESKCQPSDSAVDGLEFDREMVTDFLNNSDELLDSLTQALLNLETDPTHQESIEEIFRAAHTIKGTSGMLGFTCIEKLCHSLENTFDRVRKNQLDITPELMDTLLMGWDLVKSLFSKLRSDAPPIIPIEDFLSKLKAAENGTSPSLDLLKGTDSNSTFVQNHEEKSNPASTKNSAVKTDSSGTIRVDLKRLDALVNLVGELVIDRTRFLKIEEAMRLRGASADLSHQMAESLLLFGRHMNEVQNIIMKVRMVPVGNAFYKFSRVVRDLARQCSKEVELQIQGGETELDKTLVEEIGDPLVHLIRNCVDHGIESPDQRIKVGKSRKGKIRLTAAQQGNSIVICVEDDGQGLDVEKIRSKAIKNGLITEDEQLSQSDVFNLIFEPGFSTAEKVTNISGRGVGMDVVKRNIQKLKGIVGIDSVFGQGTKISIKLPITLAIIPSLLVEVVGECYAIPLVNVIESLRISHDDIQLMGQSRFVKLREQIIPLVKFSDVFALSGIENNFWYRPQKPTPTFSRRRDRLIFVVVGIGNERIGLVVDSLLGQQDIVIKSLGKLMGSRPGLAGGCVLGDGRVALVIDIADVVGVEGSKRGGYARRLA